MSYKMNASIHSMWIQVQNSYLSTSLGNSDGLLDHFFKSPPESFSMLSFKYEKIPNQVATNGRTLKNHHFNRHIFILFLSVINRMIMAGPLIIVIVFPISTGPDRRYSIKSSLISSCLSFSLMSFSQSNIV